LEVGADASIADVEGSIPLHYARNSAACAALLLAAHPAGVNAVDKYGGTPLHDAAWSGTADVCCHFCPLLLDAGSMVDVVNNAGFTPLYLALRKGKRANAALLLDRGARLERVKLDKHLEAIPDWAVSFVACRKSCRASCWALLELARRRSRVIGGNSRDVLCLISRVVWESRHEETWAAKEQI
jgi:hypothetical protein